VLCAVSSGLPTSAIDTPQVNKEGSLRRATPEVPAQTDVAQPKAASNTAVIATTIEPAPVVDYQPDVSALTPASPQIPTTQLSSLEGDANTDGTCVGKKCKPAVSKACKGKSDMCRNETECCEIDKCNVWQHVGRDSAVLLVFYVSWCPVSRDFMLNYDLLRAKYEPFDNLLIAKVDADQNTNLVADFGIDEYPGLVFFRRDCYWSAGGCYDQMVWQRYNGTTNEFEDVDAWLQQQLLDEQNGSAYRQLPEEPESRTGCKVSKLTRPPEDMREPFRFPADEGAPLLPPTQALLQTEETGRPSCRIQLPAVTEE